MQLLRNEEKMEEIDTLLNDIVNSDQELVEQLLGFFVDNNKWDYNRKLINVDAFILYLLTFIKSPVNGFKLISIDEIQDYNELDVSLIRKLNFIKPEFNFYGDVNQAKSSRDFKESNIYKASKNKSLGYYVLNENYRNALEITEYCNNTLKQNVIPLGVHGKYEILYGIEKLRNINADCIIVCGEADKEKVLGSIKERFMMRSALKFEDKIMTVDEAKGLEFNKVIVFNKGMSDRDKYVSYTRALSDLQIVC